MTLQELRYLVALANHRHFGRAAAACHVSQPTLSTQIKKLEDYLGVTLFERTNKALHVTPIGEEIVARARKVIDEADSIVETARARTGPLAGPFNVGVIPTLSPYLLPWLLPALKRAYAELRLIVHEDLTTHLVARLKAHKIDAALLALPIDVPGLENMALFDEPFFFAGPPGHPLVKSRTVDESDLRDQDILLLTDGHCLRDQALAVCGHPATSREEGTDFRATSLETLRGMVAAGFGCTLLPALSLRGAEAPDIAIRPLAGRPSRRIGLIWRRGYPKARDLRLLGDVVRENLPASVAPVPPPVEPSPASRAEAG